MTVVAQRLVSSAQEVQHLTRFVFNAASVLRNVRPINSGNHSESNGRQASLQTAADFGQLQNTPKPLTFDPGKQQMMGADANGNAIGGSSDQFAQMSSDYHQAVGENIQNSFLPAMSYKIWGEASTFTAMGLSLSLDAFSALGSAHSEYNGQFNKAILNTIVTPETWNGSYESYSTFKSDYGPASDYAEGYGLMDWHHIVEQHKYNIAKFGDRAIQNADNIIPLDRGIHSKVSAHYTSYIPGTNIRVRNYIKTLSFNDQYQYGFEQLIRFGWTP